MIIIIVVMQRSVETTSHNDQSPLFSVCNWLVFHQRSTVDPRISETSRRAMPLNIMIVTWFYADDMVQSLLSWCAGA